MGEYKQPERGMLGAAWSRCADGLDHVAASAGPKVPPVSAPSATNEDAADDNLPVDSAQITNTDLEASEWGIVDEVIQLRQSGSCTVYRLPSPGPGDGWTIGSAATSWMRLTDPRQLVSRTHARMLHDGTNWLIIDLESKNGVRVDGVRRAAAVLEPGVELSIGSITLIAESERLIALRGYLERILGWGDDRMAHVDHALRSLRAASTGRIPLLLCGNDDLVQIARGLHCRTLGPQRPFVVCDPRRHTTSENVRSAENCSDAAEAVRAAAGGTLCVWAPRLPRGFGDVLLALRDLRVQVHLTVCAHEPDEVRACVLAPILVPALATRPKELARVVDQYAAEALDSLPFHRHGFSTSDREWVLEHAAHSLAEIEKVTRRLIAVRETQNLNQAAGWLGMARVSLKKWLRNRRPPTGIHE
jgi:hypothetical protein